MTYEFKNLLWQKIIERKIHNRYLCLKYREINKEKCDEIDALSKSVKPGDTTNREAVAENILLHYLDQPSEELMKIVIHFLKHLHIVIARA